MTKSLEAYLSRHSPSKKDKLLCLLAAHISPLPSKSVATRRPLSFRQKALLWLFSVLFSALFLFGVFLFVLWG